jgi:hypothetical protein
MPESPHPVGRFQRLRIERLVWALDQQIYDLPGRSRVAIRREVRQNLLAAARDVGATEALRRIGGSRQLAEQYLTAELGDGPRQSWIAAAYTAALTPLLLNYVLSEAANAYQQGITASDPHASGVFTWGGISYLQSAVTYTFDAGSGSHSGGAWTPLVYVLWLLSVVAAGRLWRTLPWWRARRGRALAAQ